MMKRPFLVALLACLLFAAQNVSAGQYPETAPEEKENVTPPSPEPSTDASAARPRVVTESLPYTPYPAGLPWVITPQSFRVRWINGLYYPPQTYVRRCPYYPRGYYWGADWQSKVIGPGNLLIGRRYNPYLTAVKAQRDPKLCGQRRYAMPPGPEGQARLLLGASPSAPPALPPTMAKDTKARAAGDEENQVAAADDARDEPATRPASSRRTAKKRMDRDLQ
jgi:hypothetical protein